MDILNTLRVSATITPYNTDDTYPTHEAKYGKGGIRAVATVADRDAIPDTLREVGMFVYCGDVEKLFLLDKVIDNSGWIDFSDKCSGIVISTTEPATYTQRTVWYEPLRNLMYFRDLGNLNWVSVGVAGIDGGVF